jgi:hypothetical protein
MQKSKKYSEKTLVFLFLFFLSLVPLAVSAQDNENPEETVADSENKKKETKKDNPMSGLPLSQRLTFGGDFGLSFGNASTLINISPLIGYRITEKLTAGGGFTYLYVRGRIPGTVAVVTNTYQTYGARVFGRYNVTESFFAHTEFEYLNVPYRNNRNGAEMRTWLPMAWVGGGYRIPFGERSAFLIYAAYNLLHSQSYLRADGIAYSPYPSAIVIRTGFAF